MERLRRPHNRILWKRLQQKHTLGRWTTLPLGVSLRRFVFVVFGALMSCSASPDSDSSGATRAAVADTLSTAPLCPVLDEVTNNGVRLPEGDFNAENYESSLVYFEKELPGRLSDSLFLSPRFNETEFWMGYAYSVAYLRGYELRRSAVHERATRWPDSVALTDSSSARARFCGFLREMRLPD